jgi:hypothetical protein
MSEPWEYEEDAYLDQLYGELGPQWAEEHGFTAYQDAVKEFTAERLQSYYVAHPSLAKPAHDSLICAQSLLSGYPSAALVFATTAIELTVKDVLLKPIVFGFVHTEPVAAFIAELTTRHNGMDRFRELLSEILTRFGSVDLQTFKRAGSSRTLRQEIEEIQKARNAVIHRGEAPDGSFAELSIVVAGTLLNELFPRVLQMLGLHLHGPGVCNQKHTTTLPVTFTIPGHIQRTVSASVDINASDVDYRNPPVELSGELATHLSDSDLAAIRSAPSEAYMYVTSVPLRYRVRLDADSRKFTGTHVPWG